MCLLFSIIFFFFLENNYNYLIREVRWFFNYFLIRMSWSPRLWQLKDRGLLMIDTAEHSSDVCVVWWGIAGVVTAYMLLMHTNKSVTLLESKRIANGATWHNAWQVAAYFEKPFDEIVEEYWYELAWEWQNALITWRELLEEILLQECIDIWYEASFWYAAFSDVDQLIEHLRRKHMRDAGWVVFDALFVSDEFDISMIPHMYIDYITIVSKKLLSEYLQTNDPQYIAAWASKKWTLNSSLFCEKLLFILQDRFQSRFFVSENTHVSSISLLNKNTVKTTITRDVGFRYDWHFSQVILCTNWYMDFALETTEAAIKKRFSVWRYGIVWYMTWAFVDHEITPSCISYFPSTWDTLISSNAWDIYYYMTVRNFSWRWLVCIWWPEIALDSLVEALEQHKIPKYEHQSMFSFLQRTRRGCSIDHADFTRHWLMGYTKSGIREIWPDPDDSRLLYNLWCNGVGICSSVYGAWKIMKLFQWKTFPPSIFDIPKETHSW